MGFELVLYGFLIHVVTHLTDLGSYVASVANIAGLFLIIWGLFLVAKYNARLKVARNVAVCAVLLSILQAALIYYVQRVGTVADAVHYGLTAALFLLVAADYVMNYYLLRGMIDRFSESNQKKVIVHGERCLYLRLASMILTLVSAPVAETANAASLNFVSTVDTVSILYIIVVLWMAKNADKKLLQQEDEQ